MRRMRCLVILLAVVLLACTEPPKLSLHDRAKYTAELVESRAECRSYLQPLLEPVTDVKVIDDAYAAAMAAHCIKPDI